MIFPTTYLASLLVLIFGMISLGAWAGTQKLAKWRFELYYYDFTLGVVLCGVIAAFTFGSFNQQELTFQDNLLLTGLRKMAWAVGAGIVVNLANMLLLASSVSSGISVSFPVSLGLATIIGSIWSYVATRE